MAYLALPSTPTINTITETLELDNTPAKFIRICPVSSCDACFKFSKWRYEVKPQYWKMEIAVKYTFKFIQLSKSLNFVKLCFI